MEPYRSIGRLPPDVSESNTKKSLGPMPLSGKNVHEVAQHLMMTQSMCDDYVSVVEIPHYKLQEVHDLIRGTCKADLLLPQFSPDIKYVCITKQLFVNAHKLAKEKTRTLFNRDPGRKIAWSEGDSEGARILEQGPKCTVWRNNVFCEDSIAIELASRDTAACTEATDLMEARNAQRHGAGVVKATKGVANLPPKPERPCPRPTIEVSLGSSG